MQNYKLSIPNDLLRPVRFQDCKETNTPAGKIPFVVHLRAYGVYSEMFGKSQTAERLAERGGFAPGELDVFYPEWRKYIKKP